MRGYHCAQSTPLLYVLSTHCALFCALIPHYELSALPPLNAPAELVALRAERTAHRPPGMQPPTCSTCPSAYKKLPPTTDLATTPSRWEAT